MTETELYDYENWKAKLDERVENTRVYETIKSQHELNRCGEGKRSIEVLLNTIDYCESLEKENKILRELNKELHKCIEEYKWLLKKGE